MKIGVMKLSLVKLASFFVLFLFSSAVMAKTCPNLAGEFNLVNGTKPVKLVATQNNCQSLSLRYVTATQDFGKIYVLDGQRRQTFEDDTLVLYETEKWQGNSVVAVVEEFAKLTGKTRRAVVTISLAADGTFSIEQVFYDENNRVKRKQTLSYKRI